MGGHISERQNSDIFKEASFCLSRHSWYIQKGKVRWKKSLTYLLKRLTYFIKVRPNILSWAQSKIIVEKPNQYAQFILDSVSDPFLILTLKVSAIIKARIIPHSENKSSRYKSNIQTSSISQPLPTGDPKLWMKTLAILSMQMFLNLLIDKKNTIGDGGSTAL